MDLSQCDRKGCHGGVKFRYFHRFCFFHLPKTVDASGFFGFSPLRGLRLCRLDENVLFPVPPPVATMGVDGNGKPASKKVKPSGLTEAASGSAGSSGGCAGLQINR
jgi:hypothetical protein